MAGNVVRHDLNTIPVLYNMAKTPINEFSTDDVHLLHDASTDQLQILATCAGEQQPPNEGVLGAVGAIAATKLLRAEFKDVDESEKLDSLSSTVFPAAGKISHYPLVRR